MLIKRGEVATKRGSRNIERETKKRARGRKSHMVIFFSFI